MNLVPQDIHDKQPSVHWGEVARTVIYCDKNGEILYAFDFCDHEFGEAVLLEFCDTDEENLNNLARYQLGFFAVAEFLNREWKLAVAWFNHDTAKIEILRPGPKGTKT